MSFSSRDICRVFGITSHQLKTWVKIFITLYGRVTSGRGAPYKFGIMDLYLVGLFMALKSRGFTRSQAGDYNMNITPDELAIVIYYSMALGVNSLYEKLRAIHNLINACDYKELKEREDVCNFRNILLDKESKLSEYKRNLYFVFGRNFSYPVYNIPGDEEVYRVTDYRCWPAKQFGIDLSSKDSNKDIKNFDEVIDSMSDTDDIFILNFGKIAGNIDHKVRYLYSDSYWNWLNSLIKLDEHKILVDYKEVLAVPLKQILPLI